MTPNFVTGLAMLTPTAVPNPLAAMMAAELSAAEAPEPRQNPGFAVILLGRHQQVQGKVLQRHRDGRVTVDAGGRQVTGQPLGVSAPRGWWSRLTGAA